MQLLAEVEEEWVRTRNDGRLLRFRRAKSSPDLQFMWTDKLLGPCTIRRPVQMLKDLIQVAEIWDSAPNPASLWWTSTYDFRGEGADV